MKRITLVLISIIFVGPGNILDFNKLSFGFANFPGCLFLDALKSKIILPGKFDPPPVTEKTLTKFCPPEFFRFH